MGLTHHGRTHRLDLADPMLREGTCTVLADRRVVTKVLTRDDALALPDIIRTQSNLIPAEEPEIRIVDIVGLDVQADGGTPVASTKQVCGWSRWRARAGRTGYGSDSPTE